MDQQLSIQDIFTEKQLHHILKQTAGENSEIVTYNIRPLADGLTGYLGDHWKLTLHAKTGDNIRKVHLFVKCLPKKNEDKASFIDECNFYRREMLMFKLFEELGGDEGPNPWRAKAYLYSESILVMPDLSVDGYSTRPPLETFDKQHLQLTIASVARFHAAFANHATTKASNGHDNFLEDHSRIMHDPTFGDSPWLRAASKLSSNLVKTFSNKYKNIPNLQETLTKLYIEACESFKEYNDTLNVLVHKDLWANNIMFKYEKGVPVNCILIDFQCLRYGPPAFDLTICLYLNTSRSFREVHEKELFKYYFEVFMESVGEATKKRLQDLNYNVDELMMWCEKARRFGMLLAVTIFPYVLMDPMSGQKVFDDPETFMKYCNEDRTEPVLEHCQKCTPYRDRQLELTEEFIERCVL